MPDRFVTRGFVGRREPAGSAQTGRIPPGQHLVKDFPVLSAGPTPRTPLGSWSFKIEGLVNTDSDFRRKAVGVAMLGEALLDCDRAVDRVGRARENGEEPVTAAALLHL